MPAGTTTLKIGRRRVAVSHLDKVVYPKDHFTRARVIDYYVKVAPYLLPHLRNRPVTLKRYPEGIHGEFFYEKDAPGFTPEWVRTFDVPRRDRSKPPIRYIVINDAATLVWAAGSACLEFHPFLHCVPAIDTPTTIAFDLDPGEGVDILDCAEVAFLLRDVLTKLKLKCFPKVSGSKGVQVYVPLNTAVTYDTTQAFARAMAELLSREHPDKVVSEMARVLRQDKVFIDWNQNADHKTTVGVYSLRAKHEQPYVSLPVTWDELARALKKRDRDRLFWTADEAVKRVQRIGDLFAPVLKLKQRLPEAFAARQIATAGHKALKSLAPYEAKRDFSKTAEPAASSALRRSTQGSRRRFVVQMHAASHLHYDFRLEMHDVLRSWAVPKGVPLENGDTKTAFETEDHPVEYLDFEGNIPQGQYGGGTVMVWDIGTYEIVEGNYWKGKLAVFLSGTKLKGEWTLERARENDGKPKWLLKNSGGRAARGANKKLERSAITQRTLEQIAADADPVWHSDRAAGSNGSKDTARANARRKVRQSSPSPQKYRAPEFVPPMKATLVDELPEGEEWLYEVKWDGYRALAAKHGESVRLLSLKNKSLSTDFPGVVDAIQGIRAEQALIDGEIVAIDAQGHPSFQVLQNRAKLGQGWSIVYYAFDLLELDGADLKRSPLVERKAKLQDLLAGSEVRFNAALRGSGGAVAAAVKRAGLEGVIAKRRNSIYQARTRSADWVKFKLDRSQEFVIGGFKPAAGSFQSILVGCYEGAKLIFTGKVRQGFRPASRNSLFKMMKPLVTRRCPFANLPSSKKGHFGEGVTAGEMSGLGWVQPKLVAQVRFTEWTNYGLLRHATFDGLRDDKEPREIVREM